MIYFLSNQLTEFDIDEIHTMSLTNLNLEQFFFDLGFLESDYLAIDLETEGFEPYTKKIISFQIGNYENQVVFDWKYITTKQIKEFSEWFKNNNHTRFIFHNAKFDLRFMILHNLIPNKVLCTFLAETVLNTGKNYQDYSRSLKDVAKKYLEVELDKSVRGKIHYRGLDSEVIKYGADDVKYLIPLYQKQVDELIKNELTRVFVLECQFVVALAYTELCGIKLDVDAWNKRCKADILKSEEIENQLNQLILQDENKFRKYINNQLDLFNPDLKVKINWNSSTQVIELFKELGLDLLVKDKKTGKMKYSVEAPVLIPQKHIHPIIPIYLEYKGIQKTISTYGYNWLKHINPISQRIHTNFVQIIDTGRMSSGGKDKKTGEEYINFLNIPQDNEIRNCIIPEEGNILIDADYTGQETVILANYSQESNMVKLINDGGDMHSFVAKAINPTIAHLSDDEIKTKHKQDRQIAKAAGFAIQYGGNGYTIANNLSISIEEGDAVYNKYFNAFPKLREYFTKVQKQTMDRGYILVDKVYGRRIYISFWNELQKMKEQMNREFWQEYKEYKQNDIPIPSWMNRLIRESAQYKSVINRMSLNYPIQGCGALQIKKAVVDLFELIKKKDLLFEVKIVNIIYDQIIIETPIDISEEWGIYLKKAMENSAYLFCKNPIIKAEPEFLTKWKK